jgi:hypothetical protein
MSGWNPLAIGTFLSIEVHVVGITGDQAGQLGENKEYSMGRKGSGLI